MLDPPELYEAWRRVQQLHDIWRMIHRRCTNPKFSDYKWYGARGVSVAPQWSDFQVFLGDLLGEIGPRPVELHPNGLSYLYSLDRIDVDGDYAPGNIRWATSAEQAANRRPTRVIEVVPGHRVGRLSVLREVEPLTIHVRRGSAKVRMVLVRCDCGSEKRIRLPNLRAGKTTSCGCLKREKMRELAGQRFGPDGDFHGSGNRARMRLEG